jgi:hypothetical protein
MRLPAFISPMVDFEPVRHAPRLIAVGLAIQLAFVWWPAAPVVTAMALVALGATGATIVRLANHRAAPLLVAAHLLVYGSLYLLFVGAVLHAAAAASPRGLELRLCLDLAASIWPMAVAGKLAVAAVIRRGGEDASTRRSS